MLYITVYLNKNILSLGDLVSQNLVSCIYLCSNIQWLKQLHILFKNILYTIYYIYYIADFIIIILLGGNINIKHNTTIIPVSLNSLLLGLSVTIVLECIIKLYYF